MNPSNTHGYVSPIRDKSPAQTSHRSPPRYSSPPHSQQSNHGHISRGRSPPIRNSTLHIDSPSHSNGGRSCSPQGHDADRGVSRPVQTYSFECDYTSTLILFNNLQPQVDRKLAIPTLCVIGLCPLCIMLVFITGLSNVYIAMVSMHFLAMLLSPAIYITFMARDWVYYKRFLQYLTFVWKSQIGIGMLALVGTAAGMIIGYSFVKCRGVLGLCFPMHNNAMNEGMNGPLGELIFFGIYFCIINPPVEEFFWRIFLYRELGGLLFVNQAVSTIECPDVELGQLNCMHNHAQTAVQTTGPSTLFLYVPKEGELKPAVMDVKVNELGLWLLSMFYASYHFVVVYHLVGLLPAALSFTGLTVLGRTWMFCRNYQKLGTTTAILSHVGVDIGAAFALGNAVLRFY